MGLLDALFGRTKVAKSNVDNLFAMATAYVTLQVSHNYNSAGKAAVTFRPVSSGYFDEARRELDELLQIGQEAAGTAYTISTDEYGYVWVVLEDGDFEDLVTGVHEVSRTLGEHGFRDRLLAAVFAFSQEGSRNEVYWIYSYKQGAFYPFAPTGGKERDNGIEIRLSGSLERELPVLKEHAEWYALWGIPF